MARKSTDVLSKNTLQALEKKNITIRWNLKGKSKKEKYSKTTHLHIFRGYDLLENMIVVRQYIQRKNNIDLGLLEVLLFLAPKQFFTQADYRQIPKQFKYGSLRNLIATGYVGLLQKGENLGKDVYKINRSGHEIVRNFYELLSGEKKINEVQYENPLTRKKTRTAFDKKRMDLISQINKQPIPETKKGFYQ